MLLALWTGCLGLAPPPAAADPAADAYKEAKDRFYRLERRQHPPPDRGDYLAVARQFRKAYLLDTKGPLAADSLFQLARIHERLHRRYGVRMDLDEAVSYYLTVASLFPQHKLADDAIFAAAELERDGRKDVRKAAELYTRILVRYGQGEMAARAGNRLRQLHQQHDIPLPPGLKADSALQELVKVLPVRYWSSDDYTRVVVRASAPVHYRAKLLEPTDNQPRRLYIDFFQASVAPKYQRPIPIEDGLLQRVRTGQFDPTTVRVVLDIQSISSYKIFSLNDPFRVVIDVHGDKGKAARRSAAAGKSGRKTPRTASSSAPAVDASPPAGPAASADEPFPLLRDEKKRRPLPPGTPGSGELTLAQQLGLGVHRIVIDPGHGGRDPGAMANGLKEKDIVLDVAKHLERILESTYGYEVILTRRTDVFLPLEERTAIANTRKADLFVSIHVNAHPNRKVRGQETFYLNLATNEEAMRVAALENATSTHHISDLQDILKDLMNNSKIQESSLLARMLQDNLVRGLGRHGYRTRNLGVKQAPFYVLLGAEMPAVLVEISFITNPQEARLLARADYRRDLAREIAVGIAGYVSQRQAALAMPQGADRR